MKKSIIALVLTLSMILGMCSVSLAATQTTDPTILLESVEAEYGTDVSVRVLIQNNPGIWGMDLRISYDQSALTLTGVENGDFFEESEWTQGNLSADTYILSYEANDLDNITASSGVLAVLHFTVSDTAAEGAHAVSAAYQPGDIINVSFDDIQFSIVNATITSKLPSAVVNPFTDVSQTSYYFTPVLWAVKSEVTNGMTPTLFAPLDNCTRGQIVTFLWRAMGSPVPLSQENPFTDVAEDVYYTQAVLWAVEHGITNGTSDTSFSPDQPCTRAQAVTFLWRAANAPAPLSQDNPFTDVAEDVYYTQAVLWAVEHGITNGTSNTTFSPNDICSRGHIVTFLYRYMV